MSNSDEVKPALTAEEWPRGPGVFGWDDGSVFIAYRDEQPSVERPHAVAAVLLHGQPYGFTREDVEQLRKLAIRDSRTYGPPEDHFGWRIAARIAALLPPEPTDG